MKNNKKSKWSLFESLLASLCFHAIWVLVVFFTPKDFFKIDKPQIVEIDFINENKPINLIQKPPVPEIEKLQVVDQDEKPINDETPEQAKYLSAKNQVVKKQTIAKNRGEFKNVKTNATNAGETGRKFKPLSIDDLKPKFDISKTIQEKLELEKEMEKKSEEIAILNHQKKKALAQQPQTHKDGNNGGQTSQTIDYIKDLDPGLETLLSTKEFVYYTYYARIRRQLNQHWGPKVREKISKIYKEGRSIASSDDKVTKLLITLDKKGILVKAQILGDSGIKDLDEAAIEAFKAAAPFPNPPEGIVDPDGMILIRWDFILEA